MNHDKVPEWLYPAVERVGGLEIPSDLLALHFARRPTPEMVAKAEAVN